MDEMEKKHLWLAASGPPRAWRHKAFKGWIRDKMKKIKDQFDIDPTKFNDPTPLTLNRRHANYNLIE